MSVRDRAIKGLEPVKLAKVLFVLNAAIWLLFGVLSLLSLAGKNPDSRFALAILTTLMFGNAGAMLFCALTIGKRRRWLYLLAIAVLATNILLSITDEFGLFDFLVLALNVLLLGFLILRRKLFLPPTLSGDHLST